MNVCLSEDLLRLQGSSIENFFFIFVFPWLCIIGIVGNCLNLIVLLNSEIRHRQTSSTSLTYRSNAFLISLAFCDILFLLLMVPHSMANFDCFGLDFTFRQIYLPTKIHLISLANWCSAVATWLIIAICAERLHGIRSFFHSNIRCSCFCAQMTTSSVIVGIVLACGLLTSYNHFSHHCVVKFLCNHTQIIAKCFDVIHETWPGNHTNLTPPAIQLYVRWSQVTNVMLVIVLPILIMMALNAALLFVVRQQSFLMYNRLHSASVNSGNESYTENSTAFAKCKQRLAFRFSAPTVRKKSDKKTSLVIMVDSSANNNEKLVKNNLNIKNSVTSSQPLTTTINTSTTNITQPPVQSMFRRSIDQTVQFQAEHRCTVVVTAIVSCFTITQAPSAIVLSLSFLSGHKAPFVNSNVIWYHANSFTTILVIIGKTMNFILFCLSSVAFRRRLTKILKEKFNFWRGKRRRSSVLTVNSSNVPQQQQINIATTNNNLTPMIGSMTGNMKRPEAHRRFSLAS